MARLGPVPAEWGCSSGVYRTQGGSILVSFRRYFADLNMATLLIASRIMQRSQNRAFRQPFGVNNLPVPHQRIPTLQRFREVSTAARMPLSQLSAHRLSTYDFC